MTEWERYQKARNRKGFQGTVIKPKREAEYHKPGICERVGCQEKVYKSIYAFGYLAGLCEKHYAEASAKDKSDAVRFQYAER